MVCLAMHISNRRLRVSTLRPYEIRLFICRPGYSICVTCMVPCKPALSTTIPLRAQRLPELGSSLTRFVHVSQLDHAAISSKQSEPWRTLIHNLPSPPVNINIRELSLVYPKTHSTRTTPKLYAKYSVQFSGLYLNAHTMRTQSLINSNAPHHTISAFGLFCRVSHTV